MVHHEDSSLRCWILSWPTSPSRSRFGRARPPAHSLF